MAEQVPLLDMNVVSKRQEDLQLFRDLLSTNEVIGGAAQEDDQ